MTFCSKCGEKLPENANFCPKCGARTQKGVEAGVYPPFEEMRDVLSKMGNEMEKAFSTAAREMEKAFRAAEGNIRRSTGTEAIICSKCGQKVSHYSVYCSKCGKKLD